MFAGIVLRGFGEDENQMCFMPQVNYEGVLYGGDGTLEAGRFRRMLRAGIWLRLGRR